MSRTEIKSGNDYKDYTKPFLVSKAENVYLSTIQFCNIIL